MSHKKKHTYILALVLATLGLASCSTTKYVPDGSYLLDKVNIEVDDNVVNSSDLTQYLRQRPNFKAFGFFRLYLGAYNLSGRDSTKKINRKLKEIGEAPVLYDPFLTFQSEKELQKFMKSKGYMQAEVTSESRPTRKKKMTVNYHIRPNTPYRLGNIENNFADIDPKIDSLLSHAKTGYQQTKLKQNGLFDVDVMDEERERIASFLRRRGYYYFNKEYLTYTADSSNGNHTIDVKMHLKPFSETLPDGDQIEKPHQQYRIGHNNITTYKGSKINASNAGKMDTLQLDSNYTVIYNGKPLLRPKILEEDLRITPGSRYSDLTVDRAYARYNTLGILRASSIRFSDSHDNSNLLNCDLTLFSAKPQSFTFDIEGTNSNGDLGFAGNIGYAHKNIFRGSETLGIKAKYAQEAYSGLSKVFSNYVQDIGGEVSLNIPRFIFPFLTKDFKRRIDANTEFDIRANYQTRPNTYKRYSISTGMKYLWNYKRYYRYSFDLIDLNYIKISTSASFDSIYSADKYSVLRESYSDHFIMSMGFSIQFNNQLQKSVKNKTFYKIAVETAGNILYGINNIAGSEKNEKGQYEIGNIPYSQYVKGEFNYSYNQEFDERNHLVYHIGVGLAYPYGNGSMVPFEKRFFGGGANGVRGWSVRTLGPGNYSSENLNDFVKQSGDVKLLMNIEYRTKLIWKLEAAAFIDGGNIWTIKEYESQPNGVFRFDRFYKQIALGYGLGLRFDFSYFLIRFDVGAKAYNPARVGSEKWRFHGMNWKDDCAFHFAIGYPF